MGDKPRVVVIGGGIFGLSTAIVLGEAGYKVTVLEKRNDVMLESSLVNQNRVHMGYHYPRSTDTIKESLGALASFKEFYDSSIVTDFVKYYAIAKEGSFTNAENFVRVCEEMDLPLREGYPDAGILNRDMVEACWVTPETIFDYHLMRRAAVNRVTSNSNIRVLRNVHPSRIGVGNSHHIELSDGTELETDVIINSTYAAIDDILRLLGRQPMKYQFELCLEAILEMENPPDRFGVTIMDGPFCSLMPKGADPRHFIAYHVKHSVLQTQIKNQSPSWGAIENFPELDLLEASSQYYPIINDMKWRESWITTRVVIPDHDNDDARPTFLKDHGEQVYTIFSGKLTTCVSIARKALDTLEKL